MTAAGNIANLNTDGYKAERVDIEEGPNGVPVAVSSRDQSPGPTRLESDQDGNLSEVEMSNVDLAGEYVKSMESENAVKANLKAVSAQNDLLGEIIDTLA